MGLTGETTTHARRRPFLSVPAPTTYLLYQRAEREFANNAVDRFMCGADRLSADSAISMEEESSESNKSLGKELKKQPARADEVERSS